VAFLLPVADSRSLAFEIKKIPLFLAMQLSETESRFLEKWAKIRENKSRYIFLRFVLLWGAVSIIPSYIFGELLSLTGTPPTPWGYVIRTAFIMLFAFVAGYAQFHMSEEKYQALKKQYTK
jgi:hypothetical protein